MIRPVYWGQYVRAVAAVAGLRVHIPRAISMGRRAYLGPAP